ncbi:hypothetical protein DFJ74DRAFT_649959 [Hyaloraphidium curvatum]|nr:hypothetical protein DFJ74DRAFT_649959 [Hyaloraphidium curvatum]
MRGGPGRRWRRCARRGRRQRGGERTRGWRPAPRRGRRPSAGGRGARASSSVCAWWGGVGRCPWVRWRAASCRRRGRGRRVTARKTPTQSLCGLRRSPDRRHGAHCRGPSGPCHWHGSGKPSGARGLRRRGRRVPRFPASQAWSSPPCTWYPRP